MCIIAGICASFILLILPSLWFTWSCKRLWHYLLQRCSVTNSRFCFFFFFFLNFVFSVLLPKSTHKWQAVSIKWNLNQACLQKNYSMIEQNTWCTKFQQLIIHKNKILTKKKKKKKKKAQECTVINQQLQKQNSSTIQHWCLAAISNGDRLIPRKRDFLENERKIGLAITANEMTVNGFSNMWLVDP